MSHFRIWRKQPHVAQQGIVVGGNGRAGNTGRGIGDVEHFVVWSIRRLVDSSDQVTKRPGNEATKPGALCGYSLKVSVNQVSALICSPFIM